MRTQEEIRKRLESMLVAMEEIHDYIESFDDLMDPILMDAYHDLTAAEAKVQILEWMLGGNNE